MTTFRSTNKVMKVAGGILAAVLACLAADGRPAVVEVQSGLASFEAPTNMPGVEVKGKSNALSAHVDMTRENNTLVLQQIKATLPVKSLATGMKVRDEHMRKYIFTTADGKEPDLQFTAEPVTCPEAVHEFTCSISGTFSMRGVARPISMQLHVKEQGGSAPAFRATGDAIVKLSDYGIDPPSQFGVKPSNEVKFHLDFTAKQTVDVASSLGGSR
jgi:polyisoprenoid-binding protein YceI